MNTCGRNSTTPPRDVKRAGAVIVKWIFDQPDRPVEMDEGILPARKQDPFSEELLPKQVWQSSRVSAFQDV